MAPQRFAPLDLGPLPVARINRTLRLELEPGDVHFSARAQQHAFNRHGQDFIDCLAGLALTVNAPMYVGDDFRNQEKIELVRRVAAGSTFALVALSIELDGQGRYNITSLYPISQVKVDNRREKQHLRNLL